MNDNATVRAAHSAELIDVVRRHLRFPGPDPDWDQAGLRDLGLDSMSAIELVLDIEMVFDVVFPDELLVIETFATLTSLEAALATLTGRAR
jgi:acyl carrier protein